MISGEYTSKSQRLQWSLAAWLKITDDRSVVKRMDLTKPDLPAAGTAIFFVCWQWSDASVGYWSSMGSQTSITEHRLALINNNYLQTVQTTYVRGFYRPINCLSIYNFFAVRQGCPTRGPWYLLMWRLHLIVLYVILCCPSRERIKRWRSVSLGPIYPHHAMNSTVLMSATEYNE